MSHDESDRAATQPMGERDGAARAGALRRWGRPAAVAAAGVVAGGVLAGTLTAGADPSSSPTPGSTTSGESQPRRGDETLLTGDTAERVQAAVLAAYPGATVVRLETDSDGAYEAHLVTADGTPVTVEVGDDFAVTGTEEHAGGPRGGPGQRGDETPLTGDTAAKVEAAALAEYPGATVLRLETDSDGAYEAHLRTTDGADVTVEVGEDFAVTGTEEHVGRPGGPGHPGRGDRGSVPAPDGATPTPESSTGSSAPEATPS